MSWLLGSPIFSALLLLGAHETALRPNGDMNIDTTTPDGSGGSEIP